MAAMDYVRECAEFAGGVVTRADLEAFVFDGEQVKLIDTGRGIRNLRQLPATISLLMDPLSHYDDEFGPDGLLRYSIRTGEWGQGDNRKLHEAYLREVPVILLQKLRDAVFVPVFPAFIRGAEPDGGQNGRYILQVTEALDAAAPTQMSSELERRYVQRLTRQRVHQPLFRVMVIDAYRRKCAVCALNHAELLDAAHITPDSTEEGVPVTSNGLALCKIHDAAYDKYIIGIRPDLRIAVATKVLEETDGPMLRYGLQSFHGQALRSLPSRRRDQPDPRRLDLRWAEFIKKAG
jgi:putative restriction endonuclease